MASVAMRVDISASSSHDCWNIVFADEGGPCLEASTTTESMHDIVDAEDHVAEDAVFWTNVMVC